MRCAWWLVVLAGAAQAAWTPAGERAPVVVTGQAAVPADTPEADRAAASALALATARAEAELQLRDQLHLAADAALPDGVATVAEGTPPDQPAFITLAAGLRAVTAESAAETRFTGLVIDCRGYAFKRSMSPQIVNDDGDNLWRIESIDPTYVIEKGICAYVYTWEAALDPKGRAGRQPLLLRACGRAGPARGDAVLADDEAAVLTAAEPGSGMLGKYQVVFLIDPPVGRGTG